jgi:predicted extracellular nuclease
VTGTAFCSAGNGVTTTEVSLPAPSPTNAPAAYEPLEGMHVRLPQALVISEYFNYGRFGEMVVGLPLEGESRHFTPTSVVEPGAPAQARFAQYLVRRITLDDGLGIQNPEVLRHPNGAAFSLDNRFRGGDTVADTEGVMSWDFNLWRIQPTAAADHTAVNPRPEAIDSPDGTRVAAMNTLNFFTTLDEQNTTPPHPNDNKCGPLQNVECRGADADQPDEFDRQRTKLLAALSGLGADVIGLNELENTTGVDPLSDPDGIVPGLNDLLGAGTYDAIDTGTIGTDAIKVGLIYKPGVVTPVGDFEVLTTAVDPRFRDNLNRPVLAQTFQVNETGAIFTVAVNHLKSKGSACDAVGDPDTGDGQGNCNVTRRLAAQALVDWLASDPTGSGDPDFLIVGDLNSYAKEDPVDAVLAGPDDLLGTDDDYTNLIEQFEGEHAYSFVFDGMAGYLDHGLASATLASQVLGATEWHVNADEPGVLDYNTEFKPPAIDALFEPNEFRSADHDPLVVGLGACDDVDPTLSVDVSPDVLWPPNHRYVTVQADVDFDDNFDTSPTLELVSVTSNEPDNGEDDGNTVNDVVVVDQDTFRLRAERSGSGTGRIYTVTYRVTDDCGNSTTESATVTVPLEN